MYVSLMGEVLSACHRRLHVHLCARSWVTSCKPPIRAAISVHHEVDGGAPEGFVVRPIDAEHVGAALFEVRRDRRTQDPSVADHDHASPHAANYRAVVTVPSSKRDEHDLTVVVLTRNRPRYLEECLRSVLAQSDQSFSLVVRDSAPSEEVRAMVARLTERRPIEYLPTNDDQGTMGNIDLAIHLPKTALVMVFHDDDTMHPDLIRVERQLMAGNPELAFVATGDREIADPAAMGAFGAPPTLMVRVLNDERDLVRSFIDGGETVDLPSVMYRGAHLMGVHMDVKRFSTLADRPFLVEVSRGRPTVVLSGPWVHRRVHSGQSTQSRVLREQHIFEFMGFYRSVLAPTWDVATRRAFLRWSTNNLLDAYWWLPRAERSSLQAFVRRAISEGLLHPALIRRQGLFGLLKAVLGGR